MPYMAKFERRNDMEITRTIQIQVTEIVDSKDIGENTTDLRPIEYLEKDIREMFKDADQVLVEVKDFVRDCDNEQR